LKLDIHHSVPLRLTQFLYLSILLTLFLSPVALLIIGVATLCLMWRYRGEGKSYFVGWPEGIFAGFVCLSFISWLYDPSWYDGIPIGIIPMTLFVLYFLLTIWIRSFVKWSWPEVQKIYLQFWLAGFYVAAIVIVQQIDWYGFDQSLLRDLLYFYKKYRFQTDSEVRSIGTTGNSNLTAAMLICFALMSIYASSILKKRWQKLAAFGSFFIYCGAIWCTGSRGAWVGLVIGLIVQIWMTGHRLRTVTITLFLLSLVFTFPQIIPRKDSLSYTIHDRFYIWKSSWEVFRENWLLGTLPLHFKQVIYAKTGLEIYHAHNIFLGFATEYGIVGLTLFCVLLFVTIRRARRWRKAANTKGEKRLAGMLLSQMIALIGHGMYDYPIISQQIGPIFALSIIIIHTQYERRCLQQPGWSGPEGMEEQKSLSYPPPTASSCLM
jgi:putative inorganic carbon (hco3(-)) transporter